MKRFLFVLIIFLLFSNNALAFKKVNIIAHVIDMELYNDRNSVVYFKSESDAELKNVAYLPKKAILKAEVCLIQKEKRWHKSAYAILKVLSFKPESSDEIVDVSNDNIYLTVRKYDPVDAPYVAKTGIELGAATAASFFLPGVDVAYYFTKGALLRNKNENWFKSGVSEVYDNSIFWFIEKGKSMELEDNLEVRLKSISDKKIKKALANAKSD